MCAVSGISSGIVGVIQKIHQSSPLHNTEMAPLLLTCFATASFVSGILVLYNHKQSQPSSVVDNISTNRKLLWLIPAIGGITFAFPNIINLYLAGKVDAVIVFPLVNLSPLILSMAAAVILFKEHLTLIRWIGMAIGILAMLLVSGTIG